MSAVENRQLSAGEYRRLLRRDPGSLRFAEFADLVRRQGNLTEATALCARGLHHHPHYASGRVVMGEIFLDQQLEEQAEREWQEALRIDPGHPRAHLRLGELYLRRGDLPRARAALEAALLANPELAQARALLAHLPGQPQSDPAAVGAPIGPGSPLASRFDELLAAVRACPSVAEAVLVNRDGLPVASTPAAGINAEAGASVAAEMARQGRRVVAQLGTGRLCRALLQGSLGSLRCATLGDFTLLVAHTRGAAISTADAEVEAALIGLAGAGKGNGEGS